MAQLIIDIEDRLLADMTALASAERRAPVDVVREAISEYVREQAAAASFAAASSSSVQVGGAGNSVSVSVKAGLRPPRSLVERKRLSERTSGIWKDREVDGLEYQLEQRLEW